MCKNMDFGWRNKYSHETSENCQTDHPPPPPVRLDDGLHLRVEEAEGQRDNQAVAEE